MQTEGYPLYFFVLIAIIGLILFMYRPQYNFWAAIFYFSLRELRTAALTRIEGFGPYLNLDDFVILISLISLIRIAFKKKIKIPSVVVWLAICFLISIVMISLNYKFTYEVQREHKSALYFIIAIFLSYNFVSREKDFEIFLKILFLGSIVASFQYFTLVQEKIQIYGTGNNLETIRSVAFMSVTPSFIITSFFIKQKWLESSLIKIIYFVGLSLMLVNLILSQTRSLYISIILTIIIIYLIKKEIKVKTSLILEVIFVSFLVYIIFEQYLNIINLNEVIFRRLGLLLDSPKTDPTTISRMVAVKYEFNAFLNSNILFGNGMGFTYFISVPYTEYVAWGHIGPVAYLARMGLLGFFVYSIYIPFISLKYLLALKTNSLHLSYTKIFVLFSIALIINDWVSFWMSASYLEMGASLSGTIIGAVWAAKDKRIKLTKYPVEKTKNELH